MYRSWRVILLVTLVIASVLAGGTLVWGGTTGGSAAFVDENGRVVPTVTVSRWMWVPAAVCNNATAGAVWNLPTTNAAVPACNTGTIIQDGTLDFADGANLSAQFSTNLPISWTGNIDIVLYWFSSNAGATNVVWQFQAICIPDGQTTNPAAWDTDILQITDANKTTTLLNNVATGTLLTTSHLSSCSAGQLLYLKLFRDSAHASDTLAGTARLIGVQFTIRLSLS